MSSFATEASVQPGLRSSSRCAFSTALQSSSPCALHERFECSVAALGALRYVRHAARKKFTCLLVSYAASTTDKSRPRDAHPGLFVILAKLETAWRGSDVG